jgi:hypothetical protein
VNWSLASPATRNAPPDIFVAGGDAQKIAAFLDQPIRIVPNLVFHGILIAYIPPFGSLFGLPTWCDERLADQQRINFNAGDHSISISMTYVDYLLVEQPRIAAVAEPR